MDFEKARFQREDVEITGEETIAEGFFRYIKTFFKHRLFEGGWSHTHKREVLVKTEAAAAVLYDPWHDTIGLIEQFRIGALESEYGPWCLEVVAGMMEPGESAEELITREIFEEAGIIGPELIAITSYYSTPGCSNEKLHVFCGLCDLSDAGGIHGEKNEGEDIMLHILPAEEVFDTMLNSRMNNAATLVCLQWLQINRGKLRKTP